MGSLPGARMAPAEISVAPNGDEAIGVNLHGERASWTVRSLKPPSTDERRKRMSFENKKVVVTGAASGTGAFCKSVGMNEQTLTATE